MTKAGLESLLSTLKAQTQKTAEKKCEAGSACQPSCWMDHDYSNVYPIGNEQIISLKAMIAFAAHQSGKAEFRIERDIADRFCIPNMKCLPEQEYDNALRFVCDQSMAS